MSGYAEWYKRYGFPDETTIPQCDFIEIMLDMHCPAECPERRDLLDLGCGTGRHLVEMVRRGYNVTGVDIDPEMVRLCGEAVEKELGYAEVICSDMVNFKSSKRFAAAYCLFNTLAAVTDNESLIALFNNVRSLLINGGIFIINLTNVWKNISSGDFASGHWKEERDSGGVIQTLETNLRISPENNLGFFERIVESRDDEGCITRFVENHKVRFLSLNELGLLAGFAGFKCVGLYGDIDPIRDYSPNCCDEIYLVLKK